MTIKYLKTTLLWICLISSFYSQAQSTVPPPLQIGYNIKITSVDAATMKAAKAAGINAIEIGFGSYVDKLTGQFNTSEADILKQVNQAKKAADEAGIEIWSIHMPFNHKVDISLAKEEARIRVITLHKKVLEYCRILGPKIILFHPSWYLGLNQREARKASLVKSAQELNKVVKSIGATMVIENMLGPNLLIDNGKLERPLCRTVEETVEIMGRVPQEIGSAIDMNHIKQPEKLILAMGSRLKSVHIADGDGEDERHYFPCSGQGKNDWTAILAALDKVGYEGPFMFESKYENVESFKECYRTLYQNYINSIK